MTVSPLSGHCEGRAWPAMLLSRCWATSLAGMLTVSMNLILRVGALLPPLGARAERAPY